MALRLLALGCCMALVSGCVHPPTELQFVEGPTTADGLRPVQPVAFQLAWVREGASFAGYSGIRMRFAGISYRTPPRGKATLAARDSNNLLPEDLNEALMQELRASFGAQLPEAEAPGPAVLEARVYLVDLVLTEPLRHLGGDDRMWVDSVGAFTLVVDLHDPEQGTLLARAAERRSIGSESPRPMRAVPGDTLYECRRIFADWASKLTSLLEALRTADLAAQAAAPAVRLTRVAAAP